MTHLNRAELTSRLDAIYDDVLARLSELVAIPSLAWPTADPAHVDATVKVTHAVHETWVAGRYHASEPVVRAAEPRKLVMAQHGQVVPVVALGWSHERRHCVDGLSQDTVHTIHRCPSEDTWRSKSKSVCFTPQEFLFAECALARSQRV